MQAPTKVKLKIYQGSTFKEVIRWEESIKSYAVVTGITKAAPCIITAVGHGIPVGWRFQVTDVVGMKEINSTEDYLIATNVTTDTITVDDLNSSSFTAYTSGGVLTYNAPNSLVGVTAKMQIRSKLTSTEVLLELTTANGDILIDTAAKTITIVLSSTITAALTFVTAVYSLELTNALGEVIQLINGSISLEKEITR
jgi:hypothetical protein